MNLINECALWYPKPWHPRQAYDSYICTSENIKLLVFSSFTPFDRFLSASLRITWDLAIFTIGKQPSVQGEMTIVISRATFNQEGYVVIFEDYFAYLCSPKPVIVVNMRSFIPLIRCNRSISIANSSTPGIDVVSWRVVRLPVAKYFLFSQMFYSR